MALLQAKQIDVDSLASFILDRIDQLPLLKNKFWNLSNGVNSFSTTPETSVLIKDITITAITDTSAEVDWSVISDAVSYNLEFYPKGDDLSIQIISSITDTTYTLTGLSPSTAYEVRVRPNF